MQQQPLGWVGGMIARPPRGPDHRTQFSEQTTKRREAERSDTWRFTVWLWRTCGQIPRGKIPVPITVRPLHRGLAWQNIVLETGIRMPL